MSADSWLIDTSQSMIIVDPSEFPMGLGQTVREDYPTDSVGVMAYDGKNILPTGFGYKSFFDQSTRFNIGALTGKKVQRIFSYQTSTLVQLLVALCEDGVYVANATEGSSAPWSRIINTSAGEVDQVRRLWTVAVLANRVIMYQEGATKFWALVDSATYADAATPSPISGATRTQVWTAWGCGIVSYIPVFLNMSGQVGVFRADNRLGFWDSDGAIAWSSATYIEDFKPSAQTFAGVTKFSDVLGRIVKVIGQADGFVIYATRSIVRAIGLSGSPEKWKGSAVTSELGVAFDTQIAASQPDDTHFCITAAGLMMIKDGQAQYVAAEVTDYIVRHNLLVSLSMIEGRYLFIHTNTEFPGSIYVVEGKELEDYTGGKYTFQKPTNYAPGSKDWWGSLVDGTNGLAQDAFPDFEPNPEVPPPTAREPLIPCYDITHLDSSWSDALFTPTNSGTASITSLLRPTYTYSLSSQFIRGTPTTPSYFTAAAGIDKVTDELAQAIVDGINLINVHGQYQSDWYSAILSTVREVNVSMVPSTAPAQSYAVHTDTPAGSVTYNNHIDLSNLKLDANACDIKLYADRYTTLKVTATFSGEETFFHDSVAVPFAGYTASGDQTHWYSSSSRIPAIAVAKITAADITAATPLVTAVYGISSTYMSRTNLTKKFYSAGSLAQSAQKGMLVWKLLNHPDDVTFYELNGAINEELKATVIAEYQFMGLSGGTLESYSAAAALYVGNQAYYAAGRNGSTMYIAEANFMVGWYGDQYTVTPLYGARVTVNTSVSPNQTMWESAVQYTLDFEPAGSGQYKAFGKYSPDPALNSRLGEAAVTLISGWHEINSPAWTTNTNTINALPYNADPSGAIAWPAPTVTYTSATNTEFDYVLGLLGVATGSAATLTNKITLVGEIRFTYELTPETSETEIKLFELELSGYGYIPKGMSLFRKTHFRVFSTSCPMPSRVTIWEWPGTEDLTGRPIASVGEPGFPTNPPYQWDYPDSLPFDPNYALFQSGSLAAYYPIYAGAVVYDSLQQKWGRYDHSHKLVYELAPVNRADNTIMPVPDKGMFAGALTSDMFCTVFKEGNPEAFICYGKLGYYRLGVTKGYEVRAYFAAPAYGTLIIECSMNGQTIDPTLSQAITLNGQTKALFAFTAIAKWFNIRLEGRFHLHTLQFNGEAKGRR